MGNMLLANFKKPKELLKVNKIKKFFENCKKNKKIPRKLINNIEKAKNNKENFFNFFVELNLASLFCSKGIDFKYEPKEIKQIDFLLKDYKIAISVKSLQEKKYRFDENKKLELSKKKSIKIEDCSGTTTSLYKSSEGKHRIETGLVKAGCPPTSELKEKSKILECMAELEVVELDKDIKRILFLFGQSNEIDYGYVNDCCYYYYNNKLAGGDLFNLENYNKCFKQNKNKKSKFKKNNIDTVIYTKPYINGIYDMIWYDKINKMNINFWPQDCDVDIKNIFKT